MNWMPIQAAGAFAVLIALIYLLLYYLYFRFARAELKKIDALREENAILLYVEADALEYYLRMAITVNGSEHLDIIVNIPKTESKKDEMKDIIYTMRRKYKYIYYRMI